MAGELRLKGSPANLISNWTEGTICSHLFEIVYSLIPLILLGLFQFCAGQNATRIDNGECFIKHTVMKNLRMAFMLMVGVLLGLALESSRISHENTERATELAALRVSLDQAQEAQKNVVIQRDGLKDEADRLRQWSEDVHRLRAEVTRLKSEAAQNQVIQERTSRARVQTEAEAEKLRGELKARNGGVIPIESAPPIIQATLLREFGSALTKSAIGRFNDENGRTNYGFKGQLSDGRAASLVMGEDGSVLTKSVDIPVNTVPAHIQTPAANFFGGVAISGVREILDAGNVRYELTGKGPDSGMQMTVGGDGTILSYSAKFRPP